MTSDHCFMVEALAEARKAHALGEVPVGAVLVRDGAILARDHNRRETMGDPTAHAEILVLRAAAAAAGTWRLESSTIYVSLEPCPMCAGAMVLARIARCVYGAADPKGGFLGTLGDIRDFTALNHRFQVTPGVLAQESSDLLRGFFRSLRERGQ